MFTKKEGEMKINLGECGDFFLEKVKQRKEQSVLFGYVEFCGVYFQAVIEIGHEKGESWNTIGWDDWTVEPHVWDKRRKSVRVINIEESRNFADKANGTYEDIIDEVEKQIEKEK